MNEIFRNTYAEIRLDNLIHNYNEIKKTTGDKRFICPMVKANAYGHGDICVAQALQEAGAQHLGVGLIEEGLLLRSSGVTTRLLVFGIFDTQGAIEILKHKMIPVISTWGQLESLKSALPKIESLEKESLTPIEIHLKFDTGMHRLGFQIQEAEKLNDYLAHHKMFKPVGVCTHLWQAEDVGLVNEKEQYEGHSFEQLTKFATVLPYFARWNPHIHVYNSAGTLNLICLKSEQKTPLNSVWLWDQNVGFRPGLALYGLAPRTFMTNHMTSHLNLKPVMTLKSHVICCHEVKKGDLVSYSGTWRAKRDSLVAVVPIGYADGYKRILSNRGQVLIRGERAPVVGNVCMDYFMVDVTDIKDSKAAHSSSDPHTVFYNEEVVLFGEQLKQNLSGQKLSPQELSAHQLADWSQTIGWEILTSVGVRVPRKYIKAGT